MFVSRFALKNWRNFPLFDVSLQKRTFVVGPNASGKSNLLDALRFLRDVATAGIQQAVKDRGGLSKIRCLAARQDPAVELDIRLTDDDGKEAWRYSLGIMIETRGHRRTLVQHEQVWSGEELILDRPEPQDRDDIERLTQSHLEQINSNQAFRPIAKFLESIQYLHIVPQVVRNPIAFSGPGATREDPFGRSFLERVIKTNQNTRRSRLKKIERILSVAVPQLHSLSDVMDEGGTPHLEAMYKHWRPGAGKQREDQFSDGTLRLIGLFWSLLESDQVLLLEEPELSLNAAIVRRLPALMYRLQKQTDKQLVISTHSFDMLTDPGVGPEEVLLLTPTNEGTTVDVASSFSEVRDLLEGGMTLADALQPRMAPADVQQLDIFE